MAAGLRSFFQFLFLTAGVQRDLETAIPPVASAPREEPPDHLDAEHLNLLF